MASRAHKIIFIFLVRGVARLMNVERYKLRDVVFTSDFRGKKLLHDRMVRVDRRVQRLAAEVTQRRDDLFHYSG
jgi:hypothetical protein